MMPFAVIIASTLLVSVFADSSALLQSAVDASACDPFDDGTCATTPDESSDMSSLLQGRISGVVETAQSVEDGNYKFGAKGSDQCPQGYEPIRDERTCVDASKNKGIPFKASFNKNVGKVEAWGSWCFFAAGHTGGGCGNYCTMLTDTKWTQAYYLLCKGGANAPSPWIKKKGHYCRDGWGKDKIITVLTLEECQKHCDADTSCEGVTVTAPHWNARQRGKSWCARCKYGKTEQAHANFDIYWKPPPGPAPAPSAPSASPGSSEGPSAKGPSFTQCQKHNVLTSKAGMSFHLYFEGFFDQSKAMKLESRRAKGFDEQECIEICAAYPDSLVANWHSGHGGLCTCYPESARDMLEGPVGAQKADTSKHHPGKWLAYIRCSGAAQCTQEKPKCWDAPKKKIDGVLMPLSARDSEIRGFYTMTALKYCQEHGFDKIFSMAQEKAAKDTNNRHQNEYTTFYTSDQNVKIGNREYPSKNFLRRTPEYPKGEQIGQWHKTEQPGYKLKQVCCQAPTSFSRSATTFDSLDLDKNGKLSREEFLGPDNDGVLD